MIFSAKKFYFFILFFLLFGFLPELAKAAIVTPVPFIELSYVVIADSLVKPTFSWRVESSSPLVLQSLYLDTDKNKIFTEQVFLYKNMASDVFAYTLSEEELLPNGAQIYFWGIKAQDSEGNIGYSEIGVFSPLILKYEPILYFHPNEDFYPLRVEDFTTFSSLWDSKGTSPDERIKSESTVQVSDLTPPGIDTTNWYLQFTEDLIDKTPDPLQAQQEYQDMRGWDYAPYTYYAFQTEDSFIDEQGQTHAFIVLEYWYFYAFNDFGAKVPGGNNHEGDWETVMVFLDKESLEPQYVAYSQHHNAGRVEVPILQYDSVRRNWNSKEINKDGSQIISFIGLGSHANYPNNGNNGTHSISAYADDQTSVLGSHFTTTNWEQKIFLVSEQLPDWLTNYKSLWGVMVSSPSTISTNGANGPYYSEYNKLNQPVKWVGIDKIGHLTVMEQGIAIVEFAQNGSKMVFNKTLDIGTEIIADLHNEIISFGNNIKDLQIAPRFWDFTSNLIPDTFQAEITLKFDPQELQSFGFDDLSKLTAYTFNEALNNWTIVPTIVDLVNNAVKFQTTHFSYYAIGLLTEQEPPVLEEFTDISDKVKVVVESKKGKYNKTTGQKEISVLLLNQATENINGDLRLVVAQIDKDGVELLNADGLTEQGKPYIDFSHSYDQCVFTGNEQDLPADIQNSLKKRLLKKFIRYQKRCDKILTLYPELAPFLERDILLPKETTRAKTLKFKVPSKKERYFEVKWEVWNRK